MTIPESLKRSRLAFQVLEDGEYIPHPVPSSCFSLFVAFLLLDLLPFPISDDLVTVEGMFLLVAVVINNVTDEALDGVFVHLLVMIPGDKGLVLFISFSPCCVLMIQKHRMLSAVYHDLSGSAEGDDVDVSISGIIIAMDSVQTTQPVDHGLLILQPFLKRRAVFASHISIIYGRLNTVKILPVFLRDHPHIPTTFLMEDLIP